MKKITGVLILLIALLVPVQIIRADKHEMTLRTLEKLEKQVNYLIMGLKEMDKANPDMIKKIEKNVKHIVKHSIHLEPEFGELEEDMHAAGIGSSSSTPSNPSPTGRRN